MDLLSINGLRLAVGSDHAGFALKKAVIEHLRSISVDFTDFGTHSEDSVDYPDIGAQVARAVAKGKYNAGILICGSGIGMSIVANKVRGIRAALCLTPYLAEYSRRHNDANILCLAGRLQSPEDAADIVDIWLKTPFEGGRHQRRVEKIDTLTGTQN